MIVTHYNVVTTNNQHPLAIALSRSAGRVRVKKSRLVLYQKTNGDQPKCHWCGMLLEWCSGNGQNILANAVCADHLDDNRLNDDSENIVPSCRQCNANRKVNGVGRIQLRPCDYCKRMFKPRSKVTKFCSEACQHKSRIGVTRPTKVPHGKRTRYVKGCRCSDCRSANTNYSRKLRGREF